MYSFTTNVRFSEVDENKVLSLSSLINYFQDCSTFHSESVGLGFDYLDSVHRVWLMIAWQVKIKRLPKIGEPVLIGTWPYEFKSIYGKRNFILKNADTDELLAYANSIWCYADTENFRPVKILPENVNGYIMEEPFPMNVEDRKIAIPDSLTEMPSFDVTAAHLDCNKHVNNGRYISMAESYIPEGMKFTAISADYKEQAHLGDVIFPKVYIDDTTCLVVLAKEDGHPYTTVKFYLDENI